MLAAAAGALMLGTGAPAMAGGGYYGGGYYGGGHYSGGYYAAGYKSYGHHRHYRHRHHRYRHRHHHGGGGKAAAIALGVIGGAIILNEIAEDRARDRYARDRYYDGYYDGRRDQRTDRYYYDQSYDGGYRDDGYAYKSEPPGADDDGAYDNGAYEDDTLDDRLEGGGAAPIPISVDAAYDACLRQARAALGERGFVVSAPYRPDTAEDRGGAWLMTATVTAQRGPDRWSRAMSCEASDNRVYRLELI